jgi:UDP-N-acetylmuramate-alanine ligase
MSYDSRADTYEHIGKVRAFLNMAIINLILRGQAHDASKLVSPEVESFDEYTPKLKDLVYGSDEYRATLREMKPAVEHHYSVNSHHPEHYDNGVSGMSLMDLLEMICDWKAASERTKDGNISDSLQHNQERFGYSDELASIISNTVKELHF